MAKDLLNKKSLLLANLVLVYLHIIASSTLKFF